MARNASAQVAAPTITQRSRKRARMRQFMPLYLMLLPGAIYLIINNYMPMVGLLLAFKKVNYTLGFVDSPWVGLANFAFVTKTQDAFLIFRNTILYNIAFIILGNLLAITVAIALETAASKWFRKTSQIVILIPYLLSTIIISYIVVGFLSHSNGFINKSIIEPMGGKGITWYTKPQYWPVILTIVYLWMSFGYSSILYYSTLIGIDKSLYEAAVMDGAGTWKQIIHVTLPCLKTTIITLVLLAVGRICYSDFGLFYQVPNRSGMLLSTTQTIDTYVYRSLLEMNDIGRSSAAGFLQSILGFICVFTANMVVSKIDNESALF